MAEEAPAAAPVKTPAAAKEKRSTSRRRSAPARKSNKMTMVKQILEVLAAFKQPKGVSVPAIKKELGAKGVDVEKQNHRVNMAIRRLEQKGEIVQVRGHGASGSFRLPRKEAKKDTSKSRNAPAKSPSRKPAAKVSKKVPPSFQAAARKPGAKKAKKPGAKKAAARKPGANKAAARKPGAKKTAPNRRARTTPKNSGKTTSKMQKKVNQKKSATSKRTSAKAKK